MVIGIIGLIGFRLVAEGLVLLYGLLYISDLKEELDQTNGKEGSNKGVAAAGVGACLVTRFAKFCKYLWTKRLYRISMHADVYGDPLIYNDHQVLPDELEPGDYIFTAIPGDAPGTFATTVKGQMCAVCYFYLYKAGLELYHHGVYLGAVDWKTEQVAEFGRHTEDYPVIKPLEEFMYGSKSRKLYIRRVERGFSFPPEEIRDTALEMEGKEEWGQYEWVDNNCEHFAVYLKLRRVWSQQSHFYY